MYLENGRDIFRGILILAFAAIAYWADRTIGLALVAFMGVMILQSAFTDWCPADLFLRPMGLKRKLASNKKSSLTLAGSEALPPARQ
ncbi:MAG TPA: DUF2892 domain-containing protein [Anaerolineae bacterium]